MIVALPGLFYYLFRNVVHFQYFDVVFVTIEPEYEKQEDLLWSLMLACAEKYVKVTHPSTEAVQKMLQSNVEVYEYTAPNHKTKQLAR